MNAQSGLGAELATALQLEKERPGAQQPGPVRSDLSGGDPHFSPEEVEAAIGRLEEDAGEQARRHTPDSANGGEPDTSGEAFDFLDNPPIPQQPQEQEPQEQEPQPRQPLELAGQFTEMDQLVDYISPDAEALGIAADSLNTQFAMIQEALQRQQAYLASPEMRQLEQEDPGEAALVRIKLGDRRAQLLAAYQNLQPQARRLQETAQSQARRQFTAECAQAIPEWRDGSVCKREIAAMREHAIKHLGYTSEQLGRIWDVPTIVGLRDSWLKATATTGSGPQQHRARKKLVARKKMGFNQRYEQKVQAIDAKKRGKVSQSDKFHALAETLNELGYSL